MDAVRPGRGFFQANVDAGRHDHVELPLELTMIEPEWRNRRAEQTAHLGLALIEHHVVALHAKVERARETSRSGADDGDSLSLCRRDLVVDPQTLLEREVR